MRMTRRRKRRPDPFASPEWVRSIFGLLKAASPQLSSLTEKDLVSLSRSVRHVERYRSTDTRRGRPLRWPRESLVKVGSMLTSILSRETAGRISISTFVDHYMRILDFPADVLVPLSSGEVNLFEAEQLARVSAKRLAISEGEARRRRADVLNVHLASKSSGERLRRRVNEMLSSVRPQEVQLASGEAAKEDTVLEEFDPYDSTHLFWEEIKQLGFAFREIRREDLTDELIDELLQATQPVWTVLTKIQRQKQTHRANRLII